MDTVAVVINSYRDQPVLLALAIQSCLNQSGVNVKLILSTVTRDTSISIAKAISKDITIVASDKPGIYNQLNNALHHTHDCDWYTYFSGNDLCLETKAQDEIAICKKTGASACYSAFYFCDDRLKNPRLAKLRPYNYRQHLTVGNFVSDLGIVRTNIMKKYAPFKLKYGNYAYYDFWLRVVEGEGTKVMAYNQKPEWLYRVSGTSKHIKRRKNPEEVARYKRLKRKMLRDHRDKI